MDEVTITVRTNGPYKIVGPFRLVDADGVEFELPEDVTVALCRCGHSQTKPFCDQSHRRVGFQGDEAAARRRPA